MIKRKVMDFTTGLIIEPSRDGGILGSSMALANTRRKVMRFNTVCGKWVNV